MTDDGMPAAAGVEALVELLDREPGGCGLPVPLVQRLLALAVRCYAASVDLRATTPAFPEDDGTPGVTATEAVVAVTGILRQLNIELFELAMWQTLGDQHLPADGAGATS